MRVSTRGYVSIVVTVAIILCWIVASQRLGFDASSLRAAAFFALLGLAAQLLAYQLPQGATGNISFIPHMAAVAVAPGLSAALVTGLSMIASQLMQRRERIKVVFNVAQYTGCVAVASATYLAAGGHPLGEPGSVPAVPFAAAFGAYMLTNSASVSGVMAVSQGRRAREVWSQIMSGSLLFDLFALPAVYGFAFVYARFGALWTLAVALPLFGIRQLYKTKYQLEQVNEELLQLMVAAIEARDPYTSGHSQRVAEYSRIVSRAARLSTRAATRVYTAAIMHDVGKIHEEFAPILRKPGRLTDAEFAIMKSHSEKGAALASKVSQFLDLVPAIRGHHEAWDGSGYPDGLAGEKIPRWARVIALADTIDAMTTDRPYRDALTPDIVRNELVAQIGKQFDPVIAAALTSSSHWKSMEIAILSFQPMRGDASAASEPMPRHSGAMQQPAAHA